MFILTPVINWLINWLHNVKYQYNGCFVNHLFVLSTCFVVYYNKSQMLSHCWDHTVFIDGTINSFVWKRNRFNFRVWIITYYKPHFVKWSVCTVTWSKQSWSTQRFLTHHVAYILVYCITRALPEEWHHANVVSNRPVTFYDFGSKGLWCYPKMNIFVSCYLPSWFLNFSSVERQKS